MRVQRGDVVTAEYPHAQGTGSSVRPVLIVQADYDNQRIANVVVANITSNLRNASDPAHYLIETATPEGQRSGLQRLGRLMHQPGDLA
jgi:mRNA-degrading endonuclease toxin of MazEF toxin-antitoxin module